MDKCDECGKGTMRHGKVDYVLLGQNLGKVNALVCDVCRETVFSGDTFEIIEQRAKEKGLWGIAAKTRIGTSGNALDVKIPKSVATFLKLKKGQEVLIEPVDERKFQVAILG